LLHEYLSTYNDFGYTNIENLEDGKCLLCGGYKNYESHDDICISCRYKIRSPSGNEVYFDDISDLDPKLIKFDNETGRFIYSGKIDD